MPKEQLRERHNLKVGDRLPDGARVIDTRYVTQGAIGILHDDPEFDRRVREALEKYRDAVRRDKYGPWTVEELQEMEDRRKRERELMDITFDSLLAA